ncbi:MAG: tetratricopeptide repeat protein, partial [Terriglobia bacterium]
CHDQALAFTDMMQKYPIRKIEFTPEAQAGLGCVSCHAIKRVTSTMGNGSYIIKYPPLDRYAASKNPVLRDITYFAVFLDPKPHRSVFFKPFLHRRAAQAEFCSACHKVHLDVPVNHYRWIRGFDDYDNWQASGISGNSARSFYYPPKPQNCVDCHMPLVRSNDYGNVHGYINSHRFVAANTAVPATYGHLQQVKDVEKFLKGAVTVDLFAITQEPKGEAERPVSAGLLGGGPKLSTMFAVGEESGRGLEASEVTAVPPAKLMAPLNRGVASLRRGETARVEVVVRNRRVGHFFPGGTVDAFDCWVELKAVDNRGHVIFWSGEVADDGKGPVDPGAHFYRSYSLDRGGHWINKRNSWSAHATVYVHLIPPGAADTVHFRIKIPKNCGNKITFTAKLNYRKFDWWITQWAFAGRRDRYQT